MRAVMIASVLLGVHVAGFAAIPLHRSESARECAGVARVTPTRPRRVEVHLYGADTASGAPLAPWYRSTGVTDAWLAYPIGAFPADAGPDLRGLYSLQELQSRGVLAAYRRNHIRYWWFERPVPDFFYERSRSSRRSRSSIWDATPETDALWAGICARIGSIYRHARLAGFSGIVYDSEAYYSFKGDVSGKDKPWVWGGHEDQYGKNGAYYRRGLQIGRAVSSAWPKAKMIIAYAFGYAGESWWYEGIHDGGVDLSLGPEHTYGAGPKDQGLGDQWYQSWWQGRSTKQTCDWKRTQFPFIRDNRHVNAGLFPIDFGARKPNYRAVYFREQLRSAACDDPVGPIPVWIWPQGPFSPDSLKAVKYAAGDTAADYLDALRDYSQAFAGTRGRVN